MTKLKPCPFCGKPVSLYYSSAIGCNSVVHTNEEDDKNCCVVADILIKGKSLREAKDNWNRRADDD